MAKTKEEIKELSWIKRGKQRREIIVHIKGTKTPSEIAKESKYSLNHTSKILNEFKKHKIVKLLNPEEKTGRLYELTIKGKVIKDKLKD
jgi:predicted transcriptional regulator